MIVVTGAYGFIGSYLLGRLNQLGYGSDIVIVDDFSRSDKAPNLAGKQWLHKVERLVFLEWLKSNAASVQFIFHLGARTDTTEQSVSLFDDLNLNYSKDIWRLCTELSIPLVYASSAATYGDGSHGFSDNEHEIDLLQPLNPYGWSKQLFDQWVLKQKTTPPKWAGLKFFNVYGPNEYHKGRMASVIFHSFNKISDTGKMSLFRSHKPGIADGHQSRDFIYVDDIASMCISIMDAHAFQSGVYNAGTGKARTFLDLTINTFQAMEKDIIIDFMDTPEDIRDKYQYFTEADMSKWLTQFPATRFTSLEDGVERYVRQFLTNHLYY